MHEARITIRLEAEELAGLKKMARAMNTTAASLARGYLRSYLMGLDDPVRRDLQLWFDQLRDDMERNLALTAAALAAAVMLNDTKVGTEDEQRQRRWAHLSDMIEGGAKIRERYDAGTLG